MVQLVNAQHETCDPEASALGLKSMTAGPSRPGMVFSALHDPPSWTARKARKLPVSPDPPTAMQLPGLQHDTELIPLGPIAASPEIPGTARSDPQLSLVSVARNACGAGVPPPAGTEGRISAAVQLPGEAHESPVILATNWLIWSSMVNTASALPNVPFALLATKGCRLPSVSTNHPPTVQLPASAHDSAVMSVGPPLPRAARPGTGIACPQVK